MKREWMLQLLENQRSSWDVVVIGGGASGIGAALDAATRGYRTVLIEQHDFSKGTSSRSTKLIHGGVRYLQQGDVSLVIEALHERGLLLRNAPHLVHHQSFIIPAYDWWEGPFYKVGMKVYDLMAGKLGLGPSEHLSRNEVLQAIPTLKTEGLRGGIIYYDGQFDDSRLAINLVQSFVENGGIAINYMKCIGLMKATDGMIAGVIARDEETGKEYSLPARVVVNATGVWADDILKMDRPEAPKTIVPSQGVHVVIDKEYLQSPHAIMIPHTDDGRVLFAVPWHDKVVVGTTDTPVPHADIEPRALQDEIDFILHTASRYLAKPVSRKDVKSIFAGLRPLAAPEGEEKTTKNISRSHKIIVSVSGLITIIGGKWTTYRRMAQDAIDKAALIGGLPESPCRTHHMPIHGAVIALPKEDPLHVYGADSIQIKELMTSQQELAKPLSPLLPYTGAEVIWAVRHEMARTVEDVLARRTRALFLDARESIRIAPEVASLMAKEMKKDNHWIRQQVDSYTHLARGYLPE